MPNANEKQPTGYALKVDPETARVYLYDGRQQLFTFDSHIVPCDPQIVAGWPAVGYTADMGPWRKGEYTTVSGWRVFLADPYVGPAIALHQ